ncbi:hypothetical protein K5E40_28255 [Pseudomonas baetica]|uniref:delta-60 repeat domain-containing protein n=1 Tax=Pseudomonas baetica TaxID=674054 RepID=UPI001C8C0E65|nr:delta-60 repeat domain-containing protein [Pseudomonas baetica]MBX9409553.1 hypothetical protein [Pseudomonas baetica]
MKTEEYRAGDLDQTFGDNGAAIFNGVDYLFALATDTNDNIYAAGRTLDNKFYVARLTPDGRFDPNFGGTGYVTGNFSNGYHSQALTVNVDLQGRCLIIGEAAFSAGLARFTPDGKLDETFGDGGKLLVPPPPGLKRLSTEPIRSDSSSSQSCSCTLLSDGKILFLIRFDRNASNLHLIRLEENGTLDKTFNNTGYVEVSYEGRDLYPSLRSAIQGERLIIGASVRKNDLHFGLLAGYDLNGTLDRTFGKDGYALLEEPVDVGSEIWDLQQGSGQQIWAIGRTTPPHLGSDIPPTRGFLTRLSKDGHVDTTFNHGHPVLTPAGLDDEWIAGALQNNGNMVLAGTRFVAGAGMLGRYKSDGSLDTDFGEGGIRFLPSGGTARLVTLQKDGRIIAGGAVSPNGSRIAAVLRYHK